MPKVPQQEGPTQTLQVVTQPRVQAANLGPSPFADPLAGWAKVAEDIYQRKVKADSSDALLKYERDVQTLLYAQGEGYTYLRGKDAVDRSRGVLKKLDDLKKQYADSLEIPEAQQAFIKTAEAHALRYRQQILTHADKESRFYQGEVLKAEAGNAVTNAGLFYGDPKNMFIEKQRGLEAVNEALQLQGLDGDPDIALARRQEFLDSFHTSAVESAIGVKDLSGAERLLQEAEKELTPKAKAALEKKVVELKKSLEHQASLAEAQAVVDSVFDPENLSQSEMESAIRKELSGKAEKEAISDLRGRMRVWRQERKDKATDAFKAGYEQVVAGADPDTLAPEIADTLPVEQLDFLRRKYKDYHGDEEGGKDYLSVAQDAVDSEWNPVGKTFEEMASAIRGKLSGKEERAAITDLRARWRDFERARKAAAKEGREQEFLSAYERVLRGENPDAFEQGNLSPHEREFLASAFRVRHKKPRAATRKKKPDKISDANGWAAWNALKPAQKAEADIPSFIQQLSLQGIEVSPGIHAKMIEDQAKARKGLPNRVTELVDTAEAHDSVKTVIEKIIIPSIVGKPGKYGYSVEQKELDGRVRMVIRQILALRLQGFEGDTLTEDDAQNLALKLSKAFLDDDGKFAFAQMKPAEIEAIKRQAALENGGKPVSLTMAEIYRLWKVMKGVD